MELSQTDLEPLYDPLRYEQGPPIEQLAALRAEEAHRWQRGLLLLDLGRIDDALLDGFMITGGESLAWNGTASRFSGTGMYNVNASPTVSNCVFARNKSGTTMGGAPFGAAVYNENSDPIFPGSAECSLNVFIDQ